MKNLIFKKTSRRKLIKIIGLSVLGSAAYGTYSLVNKNIIKTNWHGTVLNNPVHLSIHSSNKKQNNLIIQQVEEFIYKADNIFNLQNTYSEIVKLNKNKYLKNPSPELMDVIKKSKIISKETNGVFDISVQPLWDYYYNHFIIEGHDFYPDDSIVKNVLSKVDWKNVKIKPDFIKLKNNASITLNGIAQGWITDQITNILKNNNVQNTLVDFGETYALGNYENNRPWNILIKGPDNIHKVVSLSNKAVATSSGSGTMFEPTNQYNHIFNPKTGLSENKFKTVSIVSNKAWLSDCLATTATMLNKNVLKKICKKFSTKAYVLEKEKFIEI